MVRTAAVIAVLIFAACGGGTGSTPSERPTGVIEGTVFNAPVAGATVRAYSFSNGTKGTVLGEALTSPSGGFSISLSAPNELVLLESVGGNYREEASARDITVPPDVPMRSVVAFSTGARVGTSITFFTTLATGFAEYLMSTGRPPAAAVDDAFGAFNSATGLDIRGTSPADVTQVSNATTTVTARHEYGFFGAAVSQWTADASITNGTPMHAVHSSVSFLKLANEDIRADGKLDGQAGASTLKVGTIALTTDVYRHQLALAMLKIADTSVNKTGLRSSQLLPAANRWNNSTAVIFGASNSTPITASVPTLSELSPSAGSTLSRTFKAAVKAVDTNGVVEVQFFIDSTLAGTAPNPANPEVQINSQSYTNGSHTLRATAKNSAGGSSSIEHQLSFNNAPTPPADTTPPSVTILTPASNVTLKNTVSATGIATDNVGVASAVFLLDGTSIGNDGSAGAPRKNIDTKKYSDGTHVLTLRATDAAGNTTNATRTLTFDNKGKDDD